MVFTPATEIEGATLLADRCRKAVHEKVYNNIGQISISIGVIQYVPGEQLDALLKRVVDLLYSAKGKGRNRVEHG